MTRFSIIAISLFLLDWALGVARLHWAVFQYPFYGINLPSSLALLWLQPPVWWRDRLAVDDGIGIAFAFGLMVLIQAGGVTALSEKCCRVRARSGTAR